MSPDASAKERDQQDPLRHWQAQFDLPDRLHYLNGNSLGALPRVVRERLTETVDRQWAAQLVGGWNDGWYAMPGRLGDKLGRLLGAAPGQTVACDSTSINLFKLLGAALQRHPERSVLILEKNAFPTDNYIAQGVQRLRPDLELRFLPPEDMARAFGPEIAAGMLSHVNYRTGERCDLPGLQAAALAQDIPLVWDLAHSAGAMPLTLDDWGVEYAVGCGYKFLNGGPGAPAFAFVSRNRQPALEPWLSGWFGHREPFAFEPAYEPADGINRLQVGTPPVLSMSALEAAVDLISEAPLDALWRKSCALFEYFLAGLRADSTLTAFEVLTPTDPARRGSQISLGHAQAGPICRALAEAGVIADYREPGILRFGLAPLYQRYQDVQAALTALHDIVAGQVWREARFQQRPAVT